MDIGTLRGLGSLMVFISFMGLLLWAFNGRRQSAFDEAAGLPFADEPGSHAPEEKTAGE
jgi:cytochrome c oxidase cbb3-type subunit IV